MGLAWGGISIDAGQCGDSESKGLAAARAGASTDVVALKRDRDGFGLNGKGCAEPCGGETRVDVVGHAEIGERCGGCA